MDKHQLLKIVFIGFASFYVIYKGIVPGWSKIITDFPNYYIAASSVNDGDDPKLLYDNEWFQSKMDEKGIDAIGKFSPQPPMTSLFMLPLVAFPPLVAKKIWLAFNLLLLIGCLHLIRKIFKFSWLDASIPILLMGRALANDLYYGQLYVFVAFFILLAYWFIEKKDWSYAGGIFLAAVTILKYFPIVLIVYALLIKKYKVVFGAAACTITLLLVQALYFGWGMNTFYVNDILLAHLSGNIPGQGGHAILYQSWPSFFNNVFVEHVVRNPDPLINWAFGKTIFIGFLYLSIGGTSGWMLMKLFKSELPEQIRKDLILLLLMMTGLTLLPATASYHFLFYLLPAAIVMKYISARYFWSLIAFIFAINFLPNPNYGKSNFILLVLSYAKLMAVTLSLLTVYWISFQQLTYKTENGH